MICWWSLDRLLPSGWSSPFIYSYGHHDDWWVLLINFHDVLLGETPFSDSGFVVRWFRNPCCWFRNPKATGWMVQVTTLDPMPILSSWLGSNCWLSVFVLGKMSYMNGWRSGDCDMDSLWIEDSFGRLEDMKKWQLKTKFVILLWWYLTVVTRKDWVADKCKLGVLAIISEAELG